MGRSSDVAKFKMSTRNARGFSQLHFPNSSMLGCISLCPGLHSPVIDVANPTTPVLLAYDTFVQVYKAVYKTISIPSPPIQLLIPLNDLLVGYSIRSVSSYIHVRPGPASGRPFRPKT